MEKRKTYYDFLRIIAAFLVIYNHVPGYTLNYTSEGIKTWIYTIIAMITKINVPIFFMITGALLLGREEKIGEIFKKRVSRITVVLLVFTAIASWIKGWPDFRFDVVRFCKEFVTGYSLPEYWFLYAYISFLVILPYLRRMVRDFSEKDFLYFITLHFLISSLIPILDYALVTSGYDKIVIAVDLKFPLMVERMIFYPVIGYYLDCKVDIHQVRRKHWIYIVLLTIGGTLIESVIMIHEGVTNGAYTQNYVMLFDYVIAIFVFVAVKYLFECKGFLANREWCSNTICRIGTLTLGMFVMDPIWRRQLFGPKWFAALEPYLPTLIVSVCWCVFSMCLSGIITWMLKKIPGFRKIL